MEIERRKDKEEEMGMVEGSKTERKKDVNDVNDETVHKEHKNIRENDTVQVDNEATDVNDLAETAGVETIGRKARDSQDISLTISPTVSQIVHVCAAHKKPRLLIRFITSVREQEKIHKMRQPGAMMIFATKIKSVKFVVDFLNRQNITSEPLHGQLPQSQRERALNDFKAVSFN